MKTTLEIPDPLFRKVKATAAQQGQTMKAFFTEALTDKLAAGEAPRTAVGWRAVLGTLTPAAKQAARAAQAAIEAADFGKIDAEMWR